MNSLPQVTVQEVAEKLRQRHQNGRHFILLDVREPLEFQHASLGNEAEPAPLSTLAQEGVNALPEAVRRDKDTEIVVMCHHGVRSAQVTMWLRQQGWRHVFNMNGGINAYALEVDPAVGRY
ncbi:MAG: hypothetical protein H6661_13405 [Ardenticatenaceae bacterium]|nr:hypothetical protein [Ardenticatenaceae bacterium]